MAELAFALVAILLVCLALGVGFRLLLFVFDLTDRALGRWSGRRR